MYRISVQHNNKQTSKQTGKQTNKQKMWSYLLMFCWRRRTSFRRSLKTMQNSSLLSKQFTDAERYPTFSLFWNLSHLLGPKSPSGDLQPGKPQPLVAIPLSVFLTCDTSLCISRTWQLPWSTTCSKQQPCREMDKSAWVRITCRIFDYEFAI